MKSTAQIITPSDCGIQPAIVTNTRRSNARRNIAISLWRMLKLSPRPRSPMYGKGDGAPNGGGSRVDFVGTLTGRLQ